MTKQDIHRKIRRFMDTHGRRGRQKTRKWIDFHHRFGIRNASLRRLS